MRTPESRAKTSAALRAWCAANPDKVKARAAKNSGPNHYNWKGGQARLNAAIRQLREHRNWVRDVVGRDVICKQCGSEIDLEAHHIEPLAEIVARHGITSSKQARDCPALWNLENGVTLCEMCHYKHHGRKYTPAGRGRRKKPRRARRSMAGEANPNYRGGKVPLTCPQCNIVFHVKPSKLNKRKCCSRKCANENQRKNI